MSGFQTEVPHHELVFPRSDEFPPSLEERLDLSLMGLLTRWTRERWQSSEKSKVKMIAAGGLLVGGVLVGGTLALPAELTENYPGINLLKVPGVMAASLGATAALVLAKNRAVRVFDRVVDRLSSRG